MRKGEKSQAPKQSAKELEARLQEAEATLAAIRSGEVDALVISGPDGEQIYTLKTAERPYRVLVEAMNEGAVTLNHDGTILYCNQSFASLLKVPTERVCGSTLSDYLVPSDRPRYEALLRQCRQKGVKGEVRLVAADQCEVPAHLSLSPLPLEDLQGVSIVITDLTEQKRQQELVASEQLLRSILEQAAEATVVCDVQGQIIHASRRAFELCASNPVLQFFDEVLPLLKPAPESPWPERAEVGAERLTFSAIRESRELRGVEATLLRADGQLLYLLLSAAPVSNHTGRVLGCVVTLVDITEQKRAEKERQRLLSREQAARAEAETASRLKDEFLATVSHELRTPLNAMFGWTRLLRTGNLDGQVVARAVEVIDRNARSQAQLIEDLLDISRIITGKMRLDIQPLDLTTVIEAAIESVRPAAEARGVQLQTTLDPKVGTVSGDANRLQQVIWNLLSNAIKFTPQGGRVQISLARVDAQAEIKVNDTGRGISPDFLPFVFDRFRQADSSSTRQYNGLGLGLAIVRQLVELHGGVVQADSDGEAQGATFTVKLPVAAIRRSPTAEPVAHPAFDHEKSLDCPPDLKGVRVLVVDDEPDTRELLEQVFRECGAEVSIAGSAKEGLATVKSWEPGVIVSDIGMPGADGYSFIQQVRAWEEESNRWAPAVALTAYARREDRLRALSAGFQTHVSKPVEPNELTAVVASLVRQGGRPKPT